MLKKMYETGEKETFDVTEKKQTSQQIKKNFNPRPLSETVIIITRMTIFYCAGNEFKKKNGKKYIFKEFLFCFFFLY